MAGMRNARSVARGVRLAWVAVATAVAGFAACFVAWRSGAPGLDVPWAPTLGLRLDLRVDGLGALYGLLATGIGATVFACPDLHRGRNTLSSALLGSVSAGVVGVTDRPVGLIPASVGDLPG